MTENKQNCLNCKKEFNPRNCRNKFCSKYCCHHVRYLRLKQIPGKMAMNYKLRNIAKRKKYALEHPNVKPYGRDPKLVRQNYRRTQLLKNYGIYLEQYENILNQQNGVCAICKKVQTKRRLAVDHDHVTGLVRGLLCTSCNVGLGLLKDDCTLLNEAIKYLTKHRAGETIPQGNTK